MCVCIINFYVSTIVISVFVNTQLLYTEQRGVKNEVILNCPVQSLTFCDFFVCTVVWQR